MSAVGRWLCCFGPSFCGTGRSRSVNKVQSRRHETEWLTCTEKSQAASWVYFTDSFRQPCTNHSADDVTLSNSSSTRSPLSRNHYSIPGSKLNFSTNLYHHSVLASTRLPSRIILDRTYSAQRFSFFVILLDYAGLTASFRAHVNIVSWHHTIDGDKRLTTYTTFRHNCRHTERQNSHLSRNADAR